MKHQKNADRKMLKTKMAEALSEDIKSLSSGLQAILLDDLTTAFESRFSVLSRAQSQNSSNAETFVELGMKIPNE